MLTWFHRQGVRGALIATLIMAMWSLATTAPASAQTMSEEQLRAEIAQRRVVAAAHDRENEPIAWAVAQTELANSLYLLWDGESTNESVSLYRAALEVLRPETTPAEWLVAEEGLGDALLRIGTSRSLAVVFGMLAGVSATDSGVDARDAALAFRTALNFQTRERDQAAWARLQTKLGHALTIEITRQRLLQAPSTETDALHNDAESAFRSALSALSLRANPVGWAEANEGLATLYSQAATFIGQEYVEDDAALRRSEARRVPYVRAAMAATREAERAYQRSGDQNRARDARRQWEHLREDLRPNRISPDQFFRRSAPQGPVPEYVNLRQEDGAPGTCRTLAHDGALADARFFDRDNRILTWSFDGTARTWNAATGEPGVVLRHQGGVTDAVMSRDETRLITTSYDQTARYWDVASGREFAPAMHHNGWVEGATLSPDETMVATFSHDHTARVWDTRTGEAISPPLNHDSVVWGAVFNANGTRLVTWSVGASVWDVRSGRRLFLLDHAGNTVKGAVYVEGESRIVSWGYDGAVRIWNAETGAQLVVLEGNEPVMGAAFSHDQHRLLTWGSSQNSVKLWDLQSGRLLRAFEGEQHSLGGAAFFDHDRRVLSWAYDDTAQIWDTETGHPIGAPMRSDDQVLGAAVSPDGTRILTWSRDRTARLFDSSTGAPIGPSMVHGGSVDFAHFSADGSRVLTTSSDHFARIWRVLELEHLTTGAGRDQLDWRCEPQDNVPPRILTIYRH